MAPSFLDAFLFHFLLSFELYGRQHSISSVFAFRIVEHFDVVEYIPPCVFSSFVCRPSDAFPFQQVEESLSDCIVMTVSTTAHTVLQIVVL